MGERATFHCGLQYCGNVFQGADFLPGAGLSGWPTAIDQHWLEGTGVGRGGTAPGRIRVG